MDRRSSHPHESLSQQIHDYFGFTPPYFKVIQAVPALLENFWRQTQAVYIHNPLPVIFKEKLFFYLSYVRGAPYDLRHHCISLQALGVPAQEMITLLNTPIPREQEKQHLLTLLRGRAEQLESWPKDDRVLENTLFSCATLLFLQTNYASQHRTELRRLLGAQYAYLTALQNYIRMCHDWLAAYSHIAFEPDEHIHKQFNLLFQPVSELRVLLDEHQARVTRSMREAEKDISELSEHKRREADRESLQQQNQLDTIQLYEMENRCRHALESLLKVAEVLLLDTQQATESAKADDTAWSAGSTIEPLIELIRSILGCERIGIMSFDAHKDVIQPVSLVGFPPEIEHLWWKHVPGSRLIEQLLDEQLVRRIMQGEVLVLSRNTLPFHTEADPHQVSTWLVVPMHIDTELVGLLSVDYGDSEHKYTNDEKHFALALGRLIALVLEHERLLLRRSEAQARAIALQETNQRMNEFLSVAGHELKTPITSIKGNVQFMRRRINKELQKEQINTQQLYSIVVEFQDLLARTEHQTNRLTILVNDVMDISRIQAKKLHLRKEHKDLIEAVRASVSQQSLLYPQRTITMWLPEQPLLMLIDIDRIEQVITNYLSNALKYSDVDKPILVTVERADEVVHLAVRDEGIGLTPFDQQHIWERFYRVEGATVRSGSNIGLGLGLSICRAIIEQHGGQVGVSSTPQNGSTFWFTLPFTV